MAVQACSAHGPNGWLKARFLAPCLIHENECAPAFHHRTESAVNFWSQDGSGHAVHPLNCHFRCELLPVRPSACECVVHFGGTDQPGTPRDSIAGETVGIALTIPALVVAADEGAHLSQVRE